MVEENPHVWRLTCTVITIWWRGAVRIHMSHVQLMCGINVHGNYYYMVEGSPHMWQLTCTVITTIIWWRGPSCVAIHVHSNNYMVEGSPHMWHVQLMCGN